MSALREWQDAVVDAVLGSGLIPGLDQTRLTAEASTAIYRNNMRVGALNALVGAFPAIRALLGEECFEGCMLRYLSAHPSRAGDLHELGVALPGYLSTVPEFADLAYLADVARLEWLQRKALIAADAAEFDFAGLSEIGEEGFAGLHFRFAPTVHIVKSPWPVYGIWRMARAAAQGEASGDAPPDVQGGEECALIYRDRTQQLRTERLSAGVGELLLGMREGLPFAQACERAWSVESDLDVGACLQHYVVSGVIEGWHQNLKGECDEGPSANVG